jgi:L-arabinose isomerase
MDRWFAEAPTHHCAMAVGHHAADFAKVADLLKLAHVVLS